MSQTNKAFQPRGEYLRGENGSTIRRQLQPTPVASRELIDWIKAETNHPPKMTKTITMDDVRFHAGIERVLTLLEDQLRNSQEKD